MNGAKTALINAIKMNLRRSLYARSVPFPAPEETTHASTSSFRFRSLTNALRTCPSLPNRKPVKQKLKFHSSVLVSIPAPVPANLGAHRRTASGTGIDRSRTSLLNSAMR